MLPQILFVIGLLVTLYVCGGSVFKPGDEKRGAALLGPALLLASIAAKLIFG